MGSTGNSSRRIRKEDLTVDDQARPGWASGLDRLPSVGTRVFCTEGMAQVVKVLGKTSTGARLLELRLEVGDTHHPFFAQASNVLVPPAEEA